MVSFSSGTTACVHSSTDMMNMMVGFRVSSVSRSCVGVCVYVCVCYTDIAVRGCSYYQPMIIKAEQFTVHTNPLKFGQLPFMIYMYNVHIGKSLQYIRVHPTIIVLIFLLQVLSEVLISTQTSLCLCPEVTIIRSKSGTTSKRGVCSPSSAILTTSGQHSSIR